MGQVVERVALHEEEIHARRTGGRRPDRGEGLTTTDQAVSDSHLQVEDVHAVLVGRQRANHPATGLPLLDSLVQESLDALGHDEDVRRGVVVGPVDGGVVGL